MSRIIVITSGKGGVGKTTSSANIGVGLAYMGYRVLLIDMDLGLRNLDVIMGLENRITYNLLDIIEGKCRTRQALIRDLRYPNLSVIAASQIKDKSALRAGQMEKFLKTIQDDFDYIFLDCPAGIENGFKNAIAAANQAIMITTPEVSSLRDADRVHRLLQNAHIENISLVINRIRYEMIRKGEMIDLNDIVDILGIDLLGNIPDDKNIIVATNYGEPVIFSDSPAAAAYRHICRRLSGEAIPLSDDIPSRFYRYKYHRTLKTG